MEITWDISIEDLVANCEEAIKICLKYGLSCIACGEPVWGTLGEIAEEQGIKDKDALLQELKEACEKGGKKLFKLDM